MGISTDIDTGNKSILVADTIAIDGKGSIISNNRYAVSAMSINNPTAGSITFTVFRTADNTSAGGVEIARFPLSANTNSEVFTAVGQGYIAGTSIILVADIAGANVDSTVTIYEDL